MWTPTAALEADSHAGFCHCNQHFRYSICRSCATTQVGLIDGEFIINPADQKQVSDMALTVASTREKVIMIEAGANEVPEQIMIDAIFRAHEGKPGKLSGSSTPSLLSAVGKSTLARGCAVPEELFAAIRKSVTPLGMERAVFTDDKQTRGEEHVEDHSKAGRGICRQRGMACRPGRGCLPVPEKTVRKMILKGSQAS